MDFATEIREAFEKKYIKVFLKESDDIELVKSTLEQIKSIHKDTGRYTDLAKYIFFLGKHFLFGYAWANTNNISAKINP